MLLNVAESYVQLLTPTRDDSPVAGSRGTAVAFIHPKTAFGTLIELVQG